MKMTKLFFFVAGFVALAAAAVAQPRPSAGQPRSGAVAEVGLATPTGHDVNASVASYTYTEPGDQSISIHGTKFGAEYTGTLSIDRRRHWFAQANVRGSVGNVTYDGWCSPFVLTPDGTSPNGYALDVGNASPCSESGDRDWYLETRGLIGKDFIGRTWAASPYAGVGLRHLSNGTSGTPGYRTDDYLYLPLGVTARTKLSSNNILGFIFEFDQLLHGWQHTHDSLLGGGDVPATPTTPAFTIDGFSDIAFSQTAGWAVRASAKYGVTAHWSIEPYYVHWNVGSSPVNYETATFTVNRVTAEEKLGAYEPLNHTNEFGLKLGVHF